MSVEIVNGAPSQAASNTTHPTLHKFTTPQLHTSTTRNSTSPTCHSSYTSTTPTRPQLPQAHKPKTPQAHNSTTAHAHNSARPTSKRHQKLSKSATAHLRAHILTCLMSCSLGGRPHNAANLNYFPIKVLEPLNWANGNMLDILKCCWTTTQGWKSERCPNIIARAIESGSSK